MGFFVYDEETHFLFEISQWIHLNLNRAIKDIAHQYGFVDAGLPIPQRPDHLGTFLAWLSDGHAADMTYLKRSGAIAVRENPISYCLNAGVYSFLWPDTLPLEQEDQVISLRRGRVAAYAGGEDYHIVLIEKLDRLAADLKIEPIARYCIVPSPIVGHCSNGNWPSLPDWGG